MIKILIITSFLCSSWASAGHLTIEDIDDCSRVANNLSTFWKENKTLIPKVMNNQPLLDEERKKLSENPNSIVQGMVREFFKEKEVFIEDLNYASSYIRLHKQKIKDELGEGNFNNLCGGLQTLIKLINCNQW